MHSEPCPTDPSVDCQQHNSVCKREVTMAGLVLHEREEVWVSGNRAGGGLYLVPDLQRTACLLVESQEAPIRSSLA